MNESPHELFKLLYKKPLKILANIKDGNGATIALAAALFLYERYWEALRSAGKTQVSDLLDQLAIDLDVPTNTAKIFWKMARHGLLHQGMLLQKKRGKSLPKYSMAPSYGQAIEFVTSENLLKINPWRVVNRVIELWENKMELFDSSDAMPVPKRYRVQNYYYTDSPGHVESKVEEY